MASATSGTETAKRSARLPRAERRAQLLAAAQQVFVAHGYHAAAMDDIAECTGVSKPVLYQHFPGKLDLYLALLDTHCDALVVQVRSAVKSTGSNRERINAAIRAYFEFIDHDGQAFRLVFESDLRNERAVRERVTLMEDACIEAITNTIISHRGFDGETARLLSAGLVGTATASARHWFSSGRTIPMSQAVHLVARLAMRGIDSFPPPDETE